MDHSKTHSMYFVAIVCPGKVDQKVLHLKHWMKEQFGCVVALRSPAHITLIPPFWWDEIREKELLQTLQSFTPSTGELEIRLEGFSHFGKRVLFITVKEDPALPEIKKQAELHFIKASGEAINQDDRPFHPHITIANRDIKPSDFIKAWEHFSKKEFKQVFQTRTVSLLKLGFGKWNVIGEKKW
jgi:2'-5' RNA ligase